MDSVRQKVRFKHYSLNTERSYCNWIKQYIFFHDNKLKGTLPFLSGFCRLQAWQEYLDTSFPILRTTLHSSVGRTRLRYAVNKH